MKKITILILVLLGCICLDCRTIRKSTKQEPLLKVGNFKVIPAHNPAITVPDPSSKSGDKFWDSRCIESSDAFYDNGTYYWYYHGSGSKGYQIGVATSKNPLGPWEKYDKNPILESESDTWESYYVACAFVVKHKGGYIMFYNGSKNTREGEEVGLGIAYADHPLGPWTKGPANPIMKYPAGKGHYLGGIMKVKDKWYMFATYFDQIVPDYGHCYLATAKSPEGPWTKRKEPVILAGNEGEWDEGGFSEFEVQYYNGLFHAFYGGTKNNEEREESIGYAWSADGIHWTKHPENPVCPISNIDNAFSFAEVHSIIEYPRIYLYYTLRYKATPEGYNEEWFPWIEDLGIQVIEITTEAISTDGDYYVSPTGDDNNDGSIGYPFQTIQKAANVVSAGDKVYVLEGTYRETVTMQTSGTSSNPIIFEGVGEAVISGADIIPSGWTQYSGSVYKNSYDLSLGAKNQVFVNRVSGDEARWPNNTDGDPITEDGSIMDSGSEIGTIVDSDLPSGNWAGARVWAMCFPCWFGWSTTIDRSSSGTLNYSGEDEWKQMPPSEGSYYYIYGSLDILDYENEWYYDGSDLYLQIAGGGNPDSVVIEARVRDVALHFNAKNYVQLKGIDVISGKIKMNGDNCLLYDSKVLYPAQDLATFRAFNGQGGVNLSGDGNTIEKCEIAYSASSGITAGGSNNTITNCWIHHHDLLGNYESAILARGTNNTYSYNTIHDTGRDGINLQGSKGVDISYNNIYNTSMMTDDSGTVYACCANFGDGKIHHNWFHDGGRSDNDQYGPGLYDILMYIDDHATNIDVYYNLLGPSDGGYAIMTNGECKNIDIINNTMWGMEGHNHITFDELTNVRVWNNVVEYFGIDEYRDKEHWWGTSIVSNYEVDAGEFKDEPNFNLRLDSGSSLIDAGRVLSPYTDGYNGSAPDAGCFEYDDTSFPVGHDW